MKPGTSVITVTVTRSDGTVETASFTVVVKGPDGLKLKELPEFVYRSIHDDDADEGDEYYEKFDYGYPNSTDPMTNSLYHYGSIHLEDILYDEDDIDLVAIDPTWVSPFKDYVSIEADQHGAMSIIYKYRPLESDLVALAPNYSDIEYIVDVPLVRTSDDSTATAKLCFSYYDCMFTLSS